MNAPKKQAPVHHKLAVVFLCLLSACAAHTIPKDDPLAMAGDPNQNPVEVSKPIPVAPPGSIQPGYLYEISQINDKSMGGRFRVDFDGKLRLPYNVVIDTSVLPETELRGKVVDAYRPFLKSVESIHVSLIQRKLWLDVRGLVTKAGRYLVDSTASFDEVLSLAGGIKPESKAEYLRIQKNEEGTSVDLAEYYETGNSSKIPAWQGGEILFIHRKGDLSEDLINTAHPVVQMLGEVKIPGEVPYKSGEDFLYYVTKAGGPSSVANYSEVEVIRMINGKRVSATYNWEQSRQLTKLFPKDIVVIHATQQTPIERFILSAAGIAAVISAIAVMIIAL